MTLKWLAELAGMVEHCVFFEQEQVRTDEGALRPDMVVRMPSSREVVVDAKTPLDAYLSAVEATDDATRAQHLQRHARSVMPATSPNGYVDWRARPIGNNSSTRRISSCCSFPAINS